MNKHKKILLGQLGKRGDCLYATAVARQIKHDYPHCHLTWAVSSMCRSIVEGNPFVDEIWEILQDTNNDPSKTWYRFESEAIAKKQNGDFDELFLTQIPPANFQNYDGTSRSSLFRGYPRPITVPVQPIVRLSASEIENVTKFVRRNNINTQDNVILFECTATSGQSFLTPDFALETVNHVLNNDKKVKFILTSDKKIITSLPNIIDASVLSFKENAELTKYCTLLVGCSSGISWLATSDWAKDLPKIQLLDAKTRMFASMIQDAKYFGLSTDRILEMQNCTPQHLADCILLCLKAGFSEAKKNYHVETPLIFDFYFQGIYSAFLKQLNIVNAVKSMNVTLERYHYDKQGTKDLVSIIRNIFFPYLDLFWNDLEEKDKKEIIDIIHYHPKNKSKIVVCVRSIIVIIIKSFFGSHTFIARIFLKDIIIKFTHTERLFE